MRISKTPKILATGLAIALLVGCGPESQLIRVTSDPDDAKIHVDGDAGVGIAQHLVPEKYNFPTDALHVVAQKPGFQTQEVDLHRDLDIAHAAVGVIPTATALAFSLYWAASAPSGASAASNLIWSGAWLAWGIYDVLHSYKYPDSYFVQLKKDESTGTPK